MSKKILLSLALAVLALAFTVGCGGNSSSSQNNRQPLDPQGNWLFTFNTANTTAIAGQLFELNPPTVTSNGLSGAIVDVPVSEQESCGGEYLLSGQASGTNSITLTMTTDPVNSNPSNSAQLNVTLTGTIADDQASMSGTLTINPGNQGSCVNGLTPDTWSAVLLAPVTGNWSGTVSNNSVSLAVTASLTENTDQTTPDLGQVTGTITLQGMPCFSSPEVITIPTAPDEATHFGEDFVIQTTADANGISLETSGTVDQGATTWNPKFGFIIHGGTCDGQNFTGTITNQQ